MSHILYGAAEEEDREDAEFAGAAAGEPGAGEPGSRGGQGISTVKYCNERENNVIVYSKVLYL